MTGERSTRPQELSEPRRSLLHQARTQCEQKVAKAEADFRNKVEAAKAERDGTVDRVLNDYRKIHEQVWDPESEPRPWPDSPELLAASRLGTQLLELVRD